MIRLLLLLSVCALLVAGCASTVRSTDPNGAVTEIRAGFGTKLTTTNPPVTVEPSPAVVEAGERVGTLVASRATEAMLTRVIDGATSAAAVR